MKQKAIFIPGKGYTVPGESGYCDGDGKPMQSLRMSPSSIQMVNRWGFGAANEWGHCLYVIPHWFLVLLSAAFAYVPWLPWQKIRLRFSLRTMLIVTAVVCVLLGLVVWRTR